MKHKQVRRKARVARVARPSQQIIAVKFDRATSKEYHYRAPTSWNISIGDKVVVDSPLSGYTVVTVTNVFDDASRCVYPGSLKHVVATIDDSDYLRRQEQVELERELLLQAEQRRKALVQLSALPLTGRANRLRIQLERELELSEIANGHR